MRFFADQLRFLQILDGSLNRAAGYRQIRCHPVDPRPCFSFPILSVEQIEIDELCPMGKLAVFYSLWDLLGFSSGMTINRADFSLQKRSASMAVSTQRACSVSLSRKAFNRDMTVDITEAIACFGIAFTHKPARKIDGVAASLFVLTMKGQLFYASM